jgi:competence protein ComEC
LFAILLAAFSIYLRLPKGGSLPIGKKVRIVEVLREEPRVFGQSQYFYLSDIRIRAKRYPEFKAGDKLEVVGVLEPQGKIEFPEVRLLAKEKGSFWQELIFHFRRFLAERVGSLLPNRQSSILLGMILGIDQIPADLKDSLRKTGTIHAVVVSGQNISIVAGFFAILVGILHRRLVIILTLLAIFLYTLLAGAQPPVVRAAIMGSLAYGAVGLGRQRLSLWALILAAALMLFVSPKLLFDLSFQLSFAATFGIVAIVPILEKFLRFLPNFLREGATVTLAAWLLTLPILAFTFGQISLIAVIVNLAIFFAILPIMILGFATIFVVVVSQVLGGIIAWFVFVPLWYFVKSVEFFARFPWAAIDVPKFGLIWVFLYYGVVLAIWIFLWQRQFRLR